MSVRRALLGQKMEEESSQFRQERQVLKSILNDKILDVIDNDYQSDVMRKRMSVYRYASFTGANPIVAREASKGGGPV